ncbi:MAG: glycosyltransferase family 1 protein [Chthoniobacterales bacterium]|nr:glycosyltransferase family 1 protein [Chthoniobacterales bacterium]
MRTSFYLPAHYMPSPQNREAWRSGGHIMRNQLGKGGCAESWIYQAWNALELCGRDVRLVTEMPDDGIVIALSGTLHAGYTPPPCVFLAAVVADGLPHPGAHVQILQNRRHAALLPGSVYMPHWPQTNLIPRDSSRGEEFRNVCFFGDPANLAGELACDEWRAGLKNDLGLEFLVRAHDIWHDYRDIDAVIAIRDFSGNRQIHKPATKLYNAWLAGVPFIGGNDSAYLAEGNPGEDYLAAHSPAELMQHLQRLCADAPLRRKLAESGRIRALEFTQEATARRWCRLVEEELPARAAAWNAKGRGTQWLRKTATHGILFVDRLLRN